MHMLTYVYIHMLFAYMLIDAGMYVLIYGVFEFRYSGSDISSVFTKAL